MSKLIMKARSGVTLVELLVVILIVTILSVSLLPLLKPYIEESKYAAEPIPVLANLQTKINLYQYDKDNLPGSRATGSTDASVASWYDAATNGNVVVFTPGQQNLASTNVTAVKTITHFAKEIDVDWQDLLGRRMNPTHFKYALLKGDGSAAYGYALGVFGDGNGLGKGTGYAVMTIVDTKRNIKIVGTWHRYKPEDDVPLCFSQSNTPYNGNRKLYCNLPPYSVAFNADADSLITWLESNDWEYNKEALKRESK